MEKDRDAALEHLRLARGDVDRLSATDATLCEKRLDLARALRRQAVEERHVRRHEIALRRIVAAAKRIERGERLAVHLQRQDEATPALAPRPLPVAIRAAPRASRGTSARRRTTVVAPASISASPCPGQECDAPVKPITRIPAATRAGHAGDRILDDDRIGRARLEDFRGVQENIRRRLAAPLPDRLRREDIGAEAVPQPGLVQRNLQPLGARVRADAARIVERVEHLLHAGDRQHLLLQPFDRSRAWRGGSARRERSRPISSPTSSKMRSVVRPANRCASSSGVIS